MKTLARGLALAGASALLLASCGAAPEDAPETAGTDGTGSAADFKACAVSDSGGFDDKSFNESSFNGLMAAEEALGIETATAESSSNAEFTPNINNLVSEGCDIIITVGFLLANATAVAAEANPDVQFGIVDSTAQDSGGQPLEFDNVKPMSYDTAQAAFLAGYVAAGMTETGVVATYGGMKIPTVTIFMDGFVDGVAKYNEVHGTDVRTEGWNKQAQDGSFTGDFEDQTKGKTLTDQFVAAGADIVMPVAGPVGAGSLASAAEQGGALKIIWVDADGVETNPDSAQYILTSVQKGIAPSVEDVVTQAQAGSFDNTAYVGTLENEGVGLAPYHEFEDAVPQELKDEVEQLKQDIIDGTIVVESPSSP
jgi:basic membrane protein A and related proteins